MLVIGNGTCILQYMRDGGRWRACLCMRCRTHGWHMYNGMKIHSVAWQLGTKKWTMRLATKTRWNESVVQGAY